MAEAGLGRQRVPHRVASMVLHGAGGPVQVIADSIEVSPWPKPGLLSDFLQLPQQRPAGAWIELISPMQLRKASPHRPPPVAMILQSALSRVRMLERWMGLEVGRWWPALTCVSGLWEDAAWSAQQRFSRRQGAPINLSGWIGRIRLEGDVSALADLLAAGEVLGIGRGISAGCGQVRVAWR